MPFPVCYFGKMRNTVNIIDDMTAEIIISSQVHGQKSCLVDREDIPRLKIFNSWNITGRVGNFYVSANICRGGSIILHRLILSFPDGLDIDHINGDTLDNRKSNLRICTHGENMRNRKVNNGCKYKGVFFVNRSKNFRAEIVVNGKRTHIGQFLDPREAALAYNEKALEIHGEFARLNVIS